MNWPGQAELGVHLSASRGKLLVKKRELGSLAWKLGLTDGDEIVMVVSPDVLSNQTGIVFDPYEIGLEKYHLTIQKPQMCDLRTIMAETAARGLAAVYLCLATQGKSKS